MIIKLMATLQSIYYFFACNLDHYETFLHVSPLSPSSTSTPATSHKHITEFTTAPVHVEPAPRRHEAVTVSGARPGAGRIGGEVCPDHGDWVVDEQITKQACARRTGRLYLLRAKTTRGPSLDALVDALEEDGA